MTRRIRLAILLTTWAILAVAGTGAYLVTRSVLLADLDASLYTRAALLPQLVGVGAGPHEPGQVPLPPGDRYLIKNAKGRTVHSVVRDTPARQPDLLSAEFVTLADGSRLRRLTLRATLPHPTDETDATYTILYSGSAERFDDAQQRLLVLLLCTGLLCALAAALVARKVTAAVVRPLNETAQTIGGIDDRHLGRRIDASRLPAELRPMGLKLNEMLARLEESLTQRKQFLADAAHELRTPVAALLTSLEVSLLRPREPAALRQTLQDCLTDVKYLRELVERLLEHARAESFAQGGARGGGNGRTSTDPAEMLDVSQVLEDCSRTAETLGAATDVRVLRNFEPGIRALLPPGRFRSIAMNLIGNAVEYNRPGGTVEVSCTTPHGQLHLVIRDTGPGIPPEHLPHIFEPFYRGDRARQRDGHSGLGLFLVRSHVTALGGSYDVQSALNEGTTFTVTLPSPLQIPPSPADGAPRETVEKRAR